MPVSDWLDLKLLQLLSRHTSGAAGALISYIIISRLVEWSIGPGVLRFMLEYIDKTVLMVIFLYFLFSVGYPLWEEIRRNVRGSNIVVA